MTQQIIHCSTKREWEEVQKEFFSKGIYWCSGKKTILDEWNNYKEESCIYHNKKILQFASKSWLLENYPNTPIISAWEFLGAPTPITKQGFPPYKSAKELGIDTSRKFVVIKDTYSFKEGDTYFLCKDDDTPAPFFSNGKEDHYMYWDNLAYAEPENKSAKEWKTGIISDVEILKILDNLRLQLNPPSFYGTSYTEKQPFLNINKPKNKFMSVINNIFKSKERKALEHFGLVNGDGGLTDLGRVELANLIYETNKELRDDFHKKIVDAYDEAIKK